MCIVPQFFLNHLRRKSPCNRDEEENMRNGTIDMAEGLGSEEAEKLDKLLCRLNYKRMHFNIFERHV